MRDAQSTRWRDRAESTNRKFQAQRSFMHPEDSRSVELAAGLVFPLLRLERELHRSAWMQRSCALRRTCQMPTSNEEGTSHVMYWQFLRETLSIVRGQVELVSNTDLLFVTSIIASPCGVRHTLIFISSLPSVTFRHWTFLFLNWMLRLLAYLPRTLLLVISATTRGS